MDRTEAFMRPDATLKGTGKISFRSFFRLAGKKVWRFLPFEHRETDRRVFLAARFEY